MRFFLCKYWYQNSIFLEFRLLLSRVAPYYSSVPRTVWQAGKQMILLGTVDFRLDVSKVYWLAMYTTVMDCLNKCGF